jgi:hypothetical protein
MRCTDVKDGVTMEGEFGWRVPCCCSTAHATLKDGEEDGEENGSYPTATCAPNGGFGVHVDVGGGCHLRCVDPSAEAKGKEREYVPNEANDDGTTFFGGHDRA